MTTHIKSLADGGRTGQNTSIYSNAKNCYTGEVVSTVQTGTRKDTTTETSTGYDFRPFTPKEWYEENASRIMLYGGLPPYTVGAASSVTLSESKTKSSKVSRFSEDEIIARVLNKNDVSISPSSMAQTGLTYASVMGKEAYAHIKHITDVRSKVAGPPNSPIKGTGNPSIPNVTYTSVDITKFSTSVQNNINELLKAYDAAKTDEDREYILAGLENVINYASSDYGQGIEQFKLRANGVITGTLQGVGGFTEMTTGATIFAGTSWTGVGIPVGVAGGYMAVDGFSNFVGGGSKAINAIFGSNEGDTLNFMKEAYKKISPEHGETIYNCTQIGIGVFTIGKGIKELPESAVQTFNRSKNIIRAQKEGLEVSTEIMDVGSKVVIVDKTQSGMILRKIVVDKSAVTTGTLLIGVDAYNASSSADSLKQK